MGRKPTLVPGMRFGRLTIVAHGGSRKWLCQCDCGTRKIVLIGNLRSGGTQSCGCMRIEKAERVRHGHTSKGHGRQTPTYGSWHAMNSRCRNPKATGYERYGGIGVTICDRWLVFETFLADMGERPEGTTLDRIDNDGNYEPGNCRWATYKQQAENKHPNPRDSTTGCFIKNHAA